MLCIVKDRATSTPGKIPYDEPQIRRSFRQPPHEPRVPVAAVRDEHSAAPSAANQPLLLAGLNPVKHLYFDVVFGDSLVAREIRDSLDKWRIVRRERSSPHCATHLC